MSEEQARRTAEAVARRSYGKLVAFLAARTRDVAAAEDALSEAFAAALAVWPANGCPANPEAWLLTTARRRMIDAVRRRGSGEAAAAQLQILADGVNASEAEPVFPDRRLALLFACATCRRPRTADLRGVGHALIASAPGRRGDEQAAGQGQKQDPAKAGILASGKTLTGCVDAIDFAQDAWGCTLNDGANEAAG